MVSLLVTTWPFISLSSGDSITSNNGILESKLWAAEFPGPAIRLIFPENRFRSLNTLLEVTD